MYRNEYKGGYLEYNGRPLLHVSNIKFLKNSQEVQMEKAYKVSELKVLHKIDEILINIYEKNDYFKLISYYENNIVSNIYSCQLIDKPSRESKSLKATIIKKH